MNTTKVYTYQAGYLIETNQGNLILTNEGLAHTTLTGNGLTEAFWDQTLQGMLQNAINSMARFTGVEYAKAFMITVNEKMEDFDGSQGS